MTEHAHQYTKNQALAQMAGGIAHDINNVLSIILGHARLLTKHHQHPELQAIIAAAQKGAGVTKRLLAFAGQPIMAVQTHNLSDLLQGLEPLIKSLLQPHSQLQLCLPQQPIWWHGDEDALAHILFNLASNARDAMAAIHNGVLSISLSTTANDGWQLHVQDQGCGIDPHIIPHIFEPFFTTKQVGQGTGLGLSSAMGLAQELGCTLKVHSVLGQGTCFTLAGLQYLAPHLNKHQQQDLLVGSLHNKHVLYVDDEVDLHAPMQAQLTDWGAAAVHCLPSGQAALMWQDQNANQPIDLLISDVVMPQMSGVKLAELFTSLHPQTATILISGFPQHISLPQLDSGKTVHILSKPVDPKVLYAACVEALLC
jgi:CheY-like chemotaxis protein